MPTIDRATYRKTIRPIGTGYDRRPNGMTPSSFLVHSTNGHRGSSLEQEAEYLRDSPKVGAHYLIGKRGEILELRRHASPAAAPVTPPVAAAVAG